MPDLIKTLVMYSSVKGDTYFVSLTLQGPNKKEHPIARYLTKTQLKYGMLTTQISVSAWEVWKLLYYTTFAVEVRVILLIAENVYVLVGLESNI